MLYKQNKKRSGPPPRFAATLRHCKNPGGRDRASGRRPGGVREEAKQVPPGRWRWRWSTIGNEENPASRDSRSRDPPPPCTAPLLLAVALACSSQVTAAPECPLRGQRLRIATRTRTHGRRALRIVSSCRYRARRAPRFRTTDHLHLPTLARVVVWRSR